jgi:N-acetylneuraminate lyase
MEFKHFEGLIAATFTPFTADGELNLGVIPEYARQLKAEGVKGVFVCGSSGEGLLMGNEERKAVAEAWMPFSEDDFRVIVHVGSTSYKMAMDLSSHAASVGASAIGCMGPCCFQPRDARSLAAFCAEVASAAPSIPFYYYHIPGTSGVNVKMNEFLIEAGKIIPNLAGIKYTSPTLMEMLECMTMENGRFDILHGHDETLLAGLSMSAKAAIGTTYNFMAPVFNKMIKKFRQKQMEEALEIQKKANEVIAIMLATGSAISGGKAMMKMSGIDCGPCRLPLLSLTAAQQTELEKKMKKVGYFKLIS